MRTTCWPWSGGWRARFDVIPYGEVAYAGEHFPLLALRAGAWQAGLPGVLVTGGVHGYETSGVHGALRFLGPARRSLCGARQPAGGALREPLGLRAHPALELRRHRPQPLLPHAQPGAGIGGADAAGGALARAVRGAHRPARNHRHRRVRVPPRAGRARRQALRARQHPRRLLPGGRHREPAAGIPAGHHRRRGARHPHRAGRCTRARSSAAPWWRPA